MLEDHAGYVLRKALMGQGISPAEAAGRAGVSLEVVESFFAGGFDRDAARLLARALGLNEEAFASHAGYHPEAISLDGVYRLDLPFGDDQVNAWLIVRDGESLLVDSGMDGASLAMSLSKVLPGYPSMALITHGHHDHVGGMAGLKIEGVPAMGWDIDGAEALYPEERREVGGIAFLTFDLSGHYTPALGYAFGGFPMPVIAVGDAIFAGSIGGCKTPESYQLALRTIHEACHHLPDETVILPGHGPATTLGEERRSNPFLAGRV
jgi:hydroxyacylglutathione hydrolase